MEVIYNNNNKERFVFMPYLQLKLVSEAAIGQNTSYRFTPQGGSIGRSNDCDWTLQDVDRYISSKHLVISFQNQKFILMDVSSNGVFINNAPTALGKNNEHVLQTSDSITIGKFCIQVESLELEDNANHQSAPSGDSGLLGLVMGSDADVSNNEASEPLLKIPENAQYGASQQKDEGLGLSELLSGSANSPITKNSSAEIKKANSFDVNSIDVSSNEPPPFVKPQESSPMPAASQHYVANDTSIPEDWELSGIMPAISDYKAPTDNNDVEEIVVNENVANDVTSATPVDVELQPTTKIETPIVPLVPESTQTSEPQETKSVTPEPKPEPILEESIVAEPSVNNIPEPEPEPEPEAVSVAEVRTDTPAVPKKSDVATSDASLKKQEDVFLNTLYKKLGLPKEYMSTIDPDTFADDIVTILLSTTKGLMSLLNSRTAFKQESRLSLTSVQPRSNNPIKFSIDPVDTLEMLLLKKKKGYMSAKDSYEEAVNDIQLHQMAFLSGLQATLTGVLGQLEPEAIETQVNDSGRSFMGLNSGAKCWQLYKEKQQVMAKKVTENLNEVLSSYFSEAYQAQINSFKNNK